MRVYINEFHPFYQVIVDGEVYDTFQANRAKDKRHNYPLTWSQQWDVASYYKEALANED
jgi:hypothetical protein